MKTRKTCSDKGCSEAAEIKGRCKRCYQREYMRAYNRSGRNKWSQQEALERKRARLEARAERVAASIKQASRNNQKRYAADKDAYLRRALGHACKKLGITVEQYEQMLKEQKGVCAICRQACTAGRRLAIDHCHKTGKTRGLLCSACNTAVGLLKDDENLLRRAVSYLKRGVLR